jgi:hypothetical protein
VAARGHQRQSTGRFTSSRLSIETEEGRHEMALQMIDGNEWESPSPGEGRGEPDTHEKGPDEAGTRGHRDQLDRPVRPFECTIHEMWQCFEVLPRGELRNDSPIGRVGLDLTGQQVRLDPTIAVHDRDRALVTRGFNP